MVKAVRLPFLVLAAAGALVVGACTATPEPAPEEDTASVAELASAELPDELAEAVAAIAPEFDIDYILTNAENVCLDIEQGKDEETLARNAALRFEVEEELGDELVNAIEPHCETIR